MLETFPGSPVPAPIFDVVGVIADAKNQGIENPPEPEVLIPYTMTGGFQRGILVRTAADPAAMLNSVRREIWAVDRGVALTNIGTLNDFLKQFSYAGPRFSLILLGVFAGVGLLLVAVGVYSVMAYAVSQQVHEIGIRMALGAQRSDVMRLIATASFRLVVVGVVLGLLGSAAAMKVLASQLFGVSPRDPATLAGVVAAMAIAAAAASYFPARRAMNVNPIVALRGE
jgi:putative ABC transport system permease protein